MRSTLEAGDHDLHVELLRQHDAARVGAVEHDVLDPGDLRLSGPAIDNCEHILGTMAPVYRVSPCGRAHHREIAVRDDPTEAFPGDRISAYDDHFFRHDES